MNDLTPKEAVQEFNRLTKEHNDYLDQIAEIAKAKGWTVQKDNHRGYSFNKDDYHMWRIENGWQTAILKDGRYQNHRPIKDNVNHSELIIFLSTQEF